RYELRGSLDGLGGTIVDTALQVMLDDDRDTPLSERMADALVAVCGWFLDHHEREMPRRRRPHVSVVVDLEKLTGRALDGVELSAAEIKTLLCDAGVSRVVT